MKEVIIRLKTPNKPISEIEKTLGMYGCPMEWVISVY